MRSPGYWGGCLGGAEQVALAQLMRRPGIVEPSTRRSRGRVFLDFILKAIHQFHEGVVQAVLAAFHAAHHFFVVHLSFQLVQPGGAFRPRLSVMIGRGSTCSSHQPKTQDQNHKRIPQHPPLCNAIRHVGTSLGCLYSLKKSLTLCTTPLYLLV